MVRLGKYELEQRIGGGGPAEVWLARLHGEHGFRKPVAVKLIQPDEELPADTLDALVNEALIGAHLKHANIVDVYEFTKIRDHLVLAMELVRGATLRRLLADYPEGLPTKLVEDLIRQVSAGLAYAHGLKGDDDQPLGLVHRNLTPSNVMVAVSGTVKILNFGIALARFAPRHTQPGTLKGTTAYMSPEQTRGDELTAKSDVWSLGALAWEAALGVPLVHDAGDVEQMVARINGLDPVKAADELRDRDAALADLIQACLHPDPMARPTAAELHQRLRASAPTDHRYGPGEDGGTTSGHSYELTLGIIAAGVVTEEADVGRTGVPAFTLEDLLGEDAVPTDPSVVVSSRSRLPGVLALAAALVLGGGLVLVAFLAAWWIGLLPG